MLIKTCLNCKFHIIREDTIKKGEIMQRSHCQKENCWSEYSNCISAKALARFLMEEHSQNYSKGGIAIEHL